jgi:L-ascorbate metabolism protein UlaG (beta-lactamase superfamily)
VHGGRRPPLGPDAPALGFVVEAGPAKVYFAGDTDVFPAMADLAPDLDVAMLPVWGWGPRLGAGHMNPRGAALALRLLRPRCAVPIHWGTLWPYGFGRVVPGRLTDPPREFARFARRYAPGVRVLLTPPGERVTFEQEGPDPAVRAPRAKPPRAPRLPALPGTGRRS